MEQTQRRLPPDWRWFRLVDIGPLVDGDWILNSDYVSSGVRLLQVGDVGTGKFVGKSSRFITSQRARELNCTLLRPGDILISRMPDPIGRACQLPDLGYECITAVDVSIWRPVEGKADRNYLTHILNSSEWFGRVLGLASGATRPRISRTNLEKLEIPLPPLHEQKRIAAILNEQLAAVGRARASAQAQLEAVTLFPATYLRSIFDGPQTEQWPLKRLGDILRLRKDIIHPSDEPRGAATFVGLEHIESFSGARIGSVSVEMSQLTGRKPKFFRGDIVYGYLRPYLNKVWVAEFDGLCSVDQYVYCVSSDLADTEFLAWFMRSPVYLSRAPIDTTPGQLPRIRTDEVASVEINLPPIREQRRIAVRMRDHMSRAQSLRSSIQAQLGAINRLPSALLRRAFAGEV